MTARRSGEPSDREQAKILAELLSQQRAVHAAVVAMRQSLEETLDRIHEESLKFRAELERSLREMDFDLKSSHPRD